MPHTVDDAVAQAVLAVNPWVQSRPEPERFQLALAGLLQAEASRRGEPEPVTGALHATALTQGPLLRAEFDLSVHAHSGWEAGALIGDVLGMIHVNQEAGFPLGDRFLRAVATALAEVFPTARVVRVHTDCFAALLLPSSDLELEESHLGLARTALERAVEAFQARHGAPRRLPGFTISGLRLRILDPSHWQVLGPLLWAEIERAQVMTRRGLATGIQRRELRLDGRVPGAGATPPG